MTSKQNRPASAKGKDVSDFEEIKINSNGGSNTQPPEPGPLGQAQDQQPCSPSFGLVDPPSGAGAGEQSNEEIPERKNTGKEDARHEARGKRKERNPETAQERAETIQASSSLIQTVHGAPAAHAGTHAGLHGRSPQANVREMLVNEDGELLELADLSFPEMATPHAVPQRATKTEPELKP
ncbi:hypothetical protein C8Q77DRAFT_1071452 [Trametes polyzona]|nr:hypothetical protein C8Q77DRAFT_1071452 [Trametes polyzona]